MAIEIISTTLFPAASGDLVRFDDVLDELDLKPTDVPKKGPFLKRAIRQVSAAIEDYCNRRFHLETVQDLCFPERDAYPYEVPGGVFRLQLKRWPVADRVVTLATTVDTPSGNLLTFGSTAGVSAGTPVSFPGAPLGLFAQTVSANQVQLSAGVPADVPAGTGVTFGLTVTITDSPASSHVLPVNTGFRIDGETGQLVRLDRFTGYPTMWYPVQSTVTYQAGYSEIPHAVQDAALREISARFSSRGRDPLLKVREQPGIGTETYWVGTRPGINGVFTEEVAGLLTPFRVPVAG